MARSVSDGRGHGKSALRDLRKAFTFAAHRTIPVDRGACSQRRASRYSAGFIVGGVLANRSGPSHPFPAIPAMHTMEITRELTFEDMSVHSPSQFTKGDAMRQLRTAPNATSLRTALSELDQTSSSLNSMLDGAKEKALGNSEQDLERIKNNVKRLKFGTIELGTECAFLQSVLESRPLPSVKNPPTESEQFKSNNKEIKNLKDANDKEARVVEQLTKEVGQAAVAFQQQHENLTVRIESLEKLEEKCELAEMGLSDADLDAANGMNPEDCKLTLEEARAAIEALDAETKVVRGALRTRTAEVEQMHKSLEPSKAKLRQIESELKLFTGADTVERREQSVSAQIAETSALAHEQKNMVESLTGCQVQEVTNNGELLTVNVVTKIPQVEVESLEPVDGTPAAKVALNSGVAPGTSASEKAHTMTVVFHPGSTAVSKVTLDPPDTPIDDVVSAVVAKGCDASALQALVSEVKVRVAATCCRAEALTRTATQTPMEWSPGSSLVRVGLYHGTGGVAAMDVPLEWPLSGARVRVVGLAGLPPAIVSAAAPKVDPGGYTSIASALRATEQALGTAGHVPTV